MTDHTMGKRKTQSAKPYDDLAISQAIAGVADPALQAFLTAVVDVVTGISGSQQLRNVEQREALAADIATERQQVYEALRDVRYQVAEGNRAREANATQVAEGLKLILQEQEGAKQVQTLLASNFSTLAESMSELVETVKEHAAMLERHEADVIDLKKEQRAVNARLSAAERTIDERPAKRAEEQQQIKDAISGVAAQLDRFFGGLIAQTPEAAQRYRELLEQLLRERGGG